MGLSSPGIGSGLDIASMVDAMVKSDLAHIQARHDKKLTSVNTEISAVGQVRSMLATLQTTLTNLSDMSQFYKMKQTISEPGYFTASVTEQAQPGVYQIQVQALAQSQTLSSAYFANSSAALGSGTITINFGTYSSDLTSFTANPQVQQLNITVAPGSDSLTAICDAINATNAGVTACIVQDSLGARISLMSTQTGVDYAMQITSDIAALNYDPTTNNASLTQNTTAQNSLVQINGILINQNSNQLENVLNGITLNLQEADTTKTISLTVERNQEHMSACINEFVKKYNDCITLLNNATGYNKETKKGEYFQGDMQIRNLKSDLYNALVNFTPPSSSPIQSLADIGVTTARGGLLEINQEQLNEAINNNYNAIGALFAKSISATDPNIQVAYMGTQAAAGTYDVIINEYTPGTSLSGTIGGLPAISTDGQTLKGTGILSSVSLNVLAGTTGNRGQIVITDGLAVVMNELLDTYQGTHGSFDKRTESLNKDLTQLNKTQEQIDARSQILEAKYLKKWNAVDLLISQLRATSETLTQALSSLPKLKVKD